jgi:ABC-2 type transport system ATP-binding protein
MDAILQDKMTELEFPTIEVQAGVDALNTSGLSKHFVASQDKKKLTPAVGLQKVWRRMRPPKRRKTAVNGVDMRIARGEIFGVVGHNGSGKSTLIRMLSTLLTPDEGSIRIFGFDPVKQPYQVQRLLNRVSVDAAFFKKLSAYENLLYAARLYGVEDKQALKRAEEILKVLGLEEGRLTDSLQELSRGMQQKVAVARALLTSPVLLLLDEPTTGLDPKSKRDVQDFVLQLRKSHDATVLLTSHDMDEVEKLCDRIALMSEGKFVEVGTAAELKEAVRLRKIGRGEAIPEAGVSMEDVFIELTGQQWKKDDEEEAKD